MTSLRAVKPASFQAPIAANDNHRKDGAHEWPAYDRLKAGSLMRTARENQDAILALCRLRHNLVAVEGRGETWTASSDSAANSDDVARGFGADVRVERVTAEHLIALGMTGYLEYRKAPDGQVLPFKVDGSKAYQLEDRYRGTDGASSPEHDDGVQAELNGRYDSAAWPSAPGAAKSAREMFHGAQIRATPAPRVTRSPEDAIMRCAYAKKTIAFLRGGMTGAIWRVLELSATGSTAEAIGIWRGHSGKYASTVGSELQRVALEALIECYADYDGCHQESA